MTTPPDKPKRWRPWKFNLSTLLLVTALFAVAVGWWADHQQLFEDRAVLQADLNAARKHLDHTEWKPILDTADSILAGRSRAGLIGDGIPAIMATRVDVAESVKTQGCSYRYYLYVRNWDFDRATAILSGWWGDEIMDAATPKSPELVADPSPMNPSVPIDNAAKRG
jgi:hypothetical protein